MAFTESSRDHSPLRGIAVLALILFALPLAGCPDVVGLGGPTIEWGWTCVPSGEYGRLILEYNYTATGLESVTYHAGLSATGSGDVTIEATTDVYDVTSSEELAVEGGQDYHVMIDLDGYYYDPADPINVGRGDEIILSSPEADDTWDQGLSAVEVTEFLDFRVETCP